MALLRTAIDEFLESRRLDAGAADHTVASYRVDLLQFAALAGVERPLAELSPEDLEAFLSKLHQDGQKASSVARKVSALRQFFKFCCLEGLMEHNPAEGLSSPRKPGQLPDALTQEEVQSLLDVSVRGLAYAGSRAASQQARDRAMIYLLYATGLRVSELVGLELAQLDLAQGFVRVTGKGGKERIVPFPPVVGKLLDEYLRSHRPAFEPHAQQLFLNPRGLALTRQAFWKTLNRLALEAGISRRISPHKIRHAFATHLLQSGMNLRSLQMLLGHSDLATTQIYTHVTPEHLKSTHRKHHPRG